MRRFRGKSVSKWGRRSSGIRWLPALVIAAICLAGGNVSAGTITDTGTNGGFSGTGFGNILSLLVLHDNGSEHGSVAWDGNAVIKTNAGNQSNVQSAATLMTNGYGSGTFPLVLNLSELGNDPEATIHDFTLRFYAADGGTLFDVTYPAPNGGQVLTDSGGAGQSGRVFTVALTPGEAANFFSNGNNRLGMLVAEAHAFEGTDDGPDNFYIPKSDDEVVPEPATWLPGALGACALGVCGLITQKVKAQGEKHQGARAC